MSRIASVIISAPGQLDVTVTPVTGRIASVLVGPPAADDFSTLVTSLLTAAAAIQSAATALGGSGGGSGSGTVALDAATLAALETVNANVSGSVSLDSPVTLDSASLAALENITAAVSGTVGVSGSVSLDAPTLAALETVTVANQPDQPLTDAQLRATSLPLPSGAATDMTLQEASGMLCILAKLLQKLRVPTGFDLAQNRQRVTAAVESGTVTTVTTVANLTSIGGYPGSILVLAGLRNAWGNTVARRFS